MEGSVRGLINTLSRNLPVGTKKIKKSLRPDSRSLDLDLKLGLTLRSRRDIIRQRRSISI